MSDGEFSSPACSLHQGESAFTDAPAPSDDWDDVRLWRKAKRAALIARRLALSPADRAAGSARITERLTGLLAAAPGRLVGFYWPFKGEYDPRPLVRTLHANGVVLALPVVVAKAQPLIFRPWWPRAPMTLGVWNIPIPAEGEPVQPDLLLVPVIGFDKAGYRLGYGGGFYDRTLAAMPVRARTIGIGFSGSAMRTIYPQAHDIPMDTIVTDSPT
jgi:5-formyltetrahydrofolate cyclo-ligase